MAGYSGNYYQKKSQNSETDFLKKLSEKAQKTVKRHKEYSPIIIEEGSRNICKSWWGQAWCQNLERYADLENRIARGKSYVKNNTVVDLQINGGDITAKVIGAARSPYDIDIHIDKISTLRRGAIIEKAAGKIKDIESLLSGKFPKNLKDIFLGEGGLFPNPKEIHFTCDCPDYAKMCKHIIAALYGVGVRFDDNPLYFFQMRGIEADSLIAGVLGNVVENMLKHKDVKSSRIIQNADLLRMFGVE